MVILNKEITYSEDEILLLNKFISASNNENIFLLLNGTNNKINIYNNCNGDIRSLPKGYVVEITNEDGGVILKNIQKMRPENNNYTISSYKMNIKLDTT